MVLGDWALRALGLGKRNGVAWLAYRLLTGLSLCAVLLVVLGSLSLSVARFVIYLLAVGGFGYELFVYSQRARSRPDESLNLAPRRPELAFVDYAAFVAIAGALGLSLVGALAPATGWDACVAHLALPQDYAREGRIYAFGGNDYSAYPHLMHCLFAFAYSQSGETSVTVLSWIFGAIACAAAFALGRRVEGFRCGVIAAAILATAPIFMDQAGTASLDLAFAGFTLAALAALMAWRDEHHSGWLILGAFLAGSACGIRHTGYLVCALLGIGVLLMAPGTRGRAVLWFGAAALAGALPWLVRSAVVTGNPFYPFFTALLGAGQIAHRDITALGAHESIRGTGLRPLLAFPWNIIMRPYWYDGWSKSPGGLVLFLGVPGLLIGSWRARGLGAFSIVGGVCFFFFQQLARYLLPFFAPMMVVAAVAACRLKTLRHGVAAVLVAAFAYGLLIDVAAVYFKVPVVLGIEDREAYLARRVERYPAFAWVNDHVPPDETVLTFDRRTYFIAGRTYQNDEVLKPLRGRPVAEQAKWLRAHGISWVLLPVTYIEESPGYRRDFLEMVNAWQRNRRCFTPVRFFDIARTRAEGTERVELYEVQDG